MVINSASKFGLRATVGIGLARTGRARHNVRLDKGVQSAARVGSCRSAAPTRCLSRDRVGLLGAMTSRAEAHTLRLSCLYALLNRSTVVRVPQSGWLDAHRNQQPVLRPRTGLQVEILALRHQIGVLRRSTKKHFQPARSRAAVVY
jgi:hypothetical protein